MWGCIGSPTNSRMFLPSKPYAEPVKALPWRVTPYAAMKSSASPPSTIGDLVRRLDRELALFAFAIGILRGVEASRRVSHVPCDIVEDFLCDGAEELVAGHLPGVGAKRTRASCEWS